jgi:hypothetical protein
MAIFPSAIATDSDLFVAVNMLSTQLTDNPLTIGATTVNVVDTTSFPSVGYISIDAEIIKYTGKGATSFTGCTRAADGSTAASHVQNSQVFHNVIAAHHNVLKEEIKAIETALGVNPSFLPLAGGTLTGNLVIPVGSVGSPSLSFTGRTSTGIYSHVTDGLTVTLGGVYKAVFAPTEIDFYTPVVMSTTLTVQGKLSGKGTTTNDNASAGYIGEYVESVIAGGSAVSSSGSGNFFTVTSISLTAGDWDISLLCIGSKAGTTTDSFFAGIGTADGNSSAGINQSTNAAYGFIPTAAYQSSTAVPSYRVSIASTTVYYFKAFFEYTGTAPTAYGRISARRVR